MQIPIEIEYSFSFDNGLKRTIDVKIDRHNLNFMVEKPAHHPLWTRLDHHKCKNCTLNEETNRYCPVAFNLAHIADKFKAFSSLERVLVNVTTQERSYSKYTSLQEGLSSLIGIVMATSGCPVLDYLRPMVRFHLPFATVSETVYRMVSMYVMAEFLLQRNGKAPDWKLEGLNRIYSEIHQVNKDFSKRIAETAKKDANINAIVNLDCFACLIPLTAEDMLKDIETNFQAYLKNND